ncbi:hypothetical protein STENM223S_03058 [Streptomyces tendae]
MGIYRMSICEARVGSEGDGAAEGSETAERTQGDDGAARGTVQMY